MDAIEILKEKLVGNSYSRFSVGDTFDYDFDEFWLIAQNVVSSDDEHLNRAMLSKYKPAIEAIDKADISTSLVSCCTLRKEIIGLSLAKDATLVLTFENDVNLHFTTDTETVDWHWAR